MELYGKDYDEKLIQIFADPKFLLPNLLGATIQVNNGFFEGKILKYEIHGRVFTSTTTVTYVIFLKKENGGKIKIIIAEGRLTMDIEIIIPFEKLNSWKIKRKIDEFKKKADELIRLERIVRKV
ncbi:STK_08120 family protein [Saccharolobus sp.]|uniref:STK_08120 family protein n=1 Tax=Saccharolobus sp. TaxID=2100761 RepID=UPI00316B7C0E